MSLIRLHFDGDIAQDHRITVRTLAVTLLHTQAAIDRAYLDNKHGRVWKHARLKSTEYIDTEFWALEPKPGGFIFEAVRDKADEILDRIRTPLAQAFRRAKSKSIENMAEIGAQISLRKDQVHFNLRRVPTFDHLLENPDEKMIRKYGDRSIVKEFDQIASLVRRRGAGESTLEIGIETDKLSEFTFDKRISQNFHQIVSRRALGGPILYRCIVRSLDRGNAYAPMRGKITNLATKRDMILHIENEADFETLVPYLREGEIQFVGAPVIEYDAFDPYGGDVYFLQLAE